MHAAVLRYLEEVARAGSIRQASERLNIAASAVMVLSPAFAGF